jgi:hypothetical protein
MRTAWREFAMILRADWGGNSVGCRFEGFGIAVNQE